MIGAAILIVAVVILALSGVIVETKDQNSTSDYNNQMSNLTDLQNRGNTSVKVSEPAITSFLVGGVKGAIKGTTITVTLPSTSGVDLSLVDPLITSKSGVVSPSGSQDFSKGPVTYTFTDNNGNIKSYIVTITKKPVELLSDKNILEVYFNEIGSEQIVKTSFNNTTKVVTVSILYGNQLNLSPFFIISNDASIMRVGDDINSNYCDYNGYYVQYSSERCFENYYDLVDFSNPIEYIVTAKDGTTQRFTVEVEVLLDSSKSILFFELSSPLAVGKINESNKTISVKVPFETNITSLAPNIAISKNAIISPSVGVARNFSTPLTYTLTAMDGTTKQYTVSVIKENLTYNLISTCQELQNINNDLNANYKLVNNIDCNNFNFTPIGGGYDESSYSCVSVFSGSFDGNGKTISDLTISSNYGVGLFGCSSGNISNVGLVNVRVIGKWWVGGLVGHQIGGIISNSFTTGRVNADAYQSGAAGGLVGYQTGNSYISNCYSTTDVSINLWDGGGLIGGGQAMINNSYSTGSVSGGMDYYLRGGLTSPESNGNSHFSNNSYWDVNTSGLTWSGTGIGKTTSEMKTPSTFSGWSTDIWDIVQGSYPTLKFQKWSNTFDVKNWGDAISTCNNWGGRLPTPSELEIGLNNQFKDGGSNPGGFVQYEDYWTSSEINVDAVWVTYWHPLNLPTGAVSFPTNKNQLNIFRCIK